jgi:hypothetical protein
VAFRKRHCGGAVAVPASRLRAMKATIREPFHRGGRRGV